MLFYLTGTTIVLGAITGFADLNEGALIRALGGQIVERMLSIGCLILVGTGFWRFGWKVGLLGLFLVIVASNAGLTLHGYLRKRFTLSSYRGTRGAAPPFETHGERGPIASLLFRLTAARLQFRQLQAC